MLWGKPLEGTADFMARPQGSGHTADYVQLSTRPIWADTDDKAWDGARDILAKVTARTGGVDNPNNRIAENIGSQPLLAVAATVDIHDTCLWTDLTVATGNPTALVCTPDTVAKAMVKYYKLGATSLLVRGYDPRADAIQYGKELIPKVRELVAAYDAGTA
jgi:alkanesulfonate monooxygenase